MQQRLVADLRAQAGEPGGELRVEDLGDLGVPGPAQQRHVLAAGVHHDLDLRVGEDERQRRAVQLFVERVEHLDAAGAAVVPGDGDLDQAQQRAVAALTHELGVDRERAGLPGALGELGGNVSAH